MPAIEIEFEVFCGTCGAGLCKDTSVDTYRGHQRIVVECCANCLKTAKEEGKDDGYSEGHSDGHDAGYDEGYKDGKDNNTPD